LLFRNICSLSGWAKKHICSSQKTLIKQKNKAPYELLVIQMRNLIKVNILVLKTFSLLFLMMATSTVAAQEKQSFKQKLFKKNRSQKKVGQAKVDSIKTIYQLVAGRMKKNKAKQQEMEGLTTWYYSEIKRQTEEYKLPTKKDNITKQNKKPETEVVVEKAEKKATQTVNPKQGKVTDKASKKNKTDKQEEKVAQKLKKTTKQKKTDYIDTLYYIAPINKVTKTAANNNIDKTDLTLPFRNELDKPKYFSDIEIGEYADYFAFNEWEIPTQPDEFIQKKVERFPSILPLVFNDDVKRQIKELTNSPINRRWIEEILGKIEYYFPMYEQVFDQYGIPVEVKYLSVIESGLNPKALSPMGAKGLWQFMPGTARQYKLKNNSMIDEARDPQKATRAAASYLNNMYTEFHDWFLSLAAYNCGPGNVRKAIRRTKEGPKDYWGIQKYLPRETRNYIPKFIAMIYVLNNPEAHNLKAKPLDYELQKIDTIHLHQQINTNDLVKYCGIKKEHIKFLNPILKTSQTPPANPTFVLKIPYSKLENVLNYRDEIMPRSQTVASNAAPNYGSAHLSGEFVHTIKKGENLDGISKKYGVSVSELKSWNGLNSNLIREGQNLYIYK